DSCPNQNFKDKHVCEDCTSCQAALVHSQKARENSPAPFNHVFTGNFGYNQTRCLDRGVEVDCCKINPEVTTWKCKFNNATKEWDSCVDNDGNPTVDPYGTCTGESLLNGSGHFFFQNITCTFKR
ncbi:unnamed protein product, partial [Meganyctiphanes norvegica]